MEQSGECGVAGGTLVQAARQPLNLKYSTRLHLQPLTATCSLETAYMYLTVAVVGSDSPGAESRRPLILQHVWEPVDVPPCNEIHIPYPIYIDLTSRTCHQLLSSREDTYHDVGKD